MNKIAAESTFTSPWFSAKIVLQPKSAEMKRTGDVDDLKIVKPHFIAGPVFLR